LAKEKPPILGLIHYGGEIALHDTRGEYSHGEDSDGFYEVRVCRSTDRGTRIQTVPCRCLACAARE
jgi:hypothetical protein